MKLTNQIISTQDLTATLRLLPNPSEIIKNKGGTISVYNKVAQQPDVFAVVQNYRDALCNMQLFSDDPFFDKYLNNIDAYSLLRNCLSARDYGFSVLEVIQYDSFEGKTVPVQIQACPLDKFVFDKDRNLRLITRNNPDGIDVAKTYPNKFILVQNEPTLVNPYGTALYDIAYWLSVGLNGNFEFMMEFAEQDGRDKWIGKVPESASQEDRYELLSAALRLRANGAAVINENTQLAPQTYASRSGVGQLYKDIDEMLRRKVEKLWNGTDLTMQVDGKGGFSSSKSGLMVREDALAQGRRLIQQGLRQLYHIICQLNGAEPQKIAINLFSPREATKEEAETDLIYFQMGLSPTEAFFQNRGYNTDEFQIVKRAQRLSQDFSKNDALEDIFDVFKKDLSRSPNS